jgi:hypothetical protein
MNHDSATAAQAAGRLPTSPGQAAFGAIAEIVSLLEADPSTDWKKVDLERLRQHLIDMNEVTMNAMVTSANIEGGLRMQITGSGNTVGSIKRMLTAHVIQLEAASEYQASATPLPNGMVLNVVAKRASDSDAVSRIRGLGFIGLLAYGNHHSVHHLALARGDVMPGHGH